MQWLKKLIDLILYGNFWIAICAMAMIFQSQRIFNQPLAFDSLSLFVFASTLFLYAIHRIVGISKLHEFFDIDRYKVIAQYKTHIQIYAFLGLLITAYLFFQLSNPVKFSLIIPGIFSLAYVIPFLNGRKRRIRDINFVKIFLIAIVWAWITVWLPALEYGINDQGFLLRMGIERALFIFAITLPFDIRDLKVDQHSDVKTIPSIIGIRNTKLMSIISLAIALGLVFYNFQTYHYNYPVSLGLVISMISTAILILFSSPKRHDYFYSGLMDGTMLFQFLFIEGLIWYFF